MSLRPDRSRDQLKWKQLEQKKDGSWVLGLPPHYARLFEACFPSIMAKSKNGFRYSSTGKTKLAFFPSLDNQAFKKVDGFLQFYERAVYLGRNKHLEGHFSEELDLCHALDFNKPSPDEGRTEIGEWEYQAKYNQDEEALAALAQKLSTAIGWLPRSSIPKPRLLSYVPSGPEKVFYLPVRLAQAVLGFVAETTWGDATPLVVPSLKAPKQSAKNMKVEEKIAQWEKIVLAGGITLSRSVRDCSVIVIDDLYQSGASLWSYAKYLKSQGAVMVIGLACVKSLRDTDNL